MSDFVDDALKRAKMFTEQLDQVKADPVGAHKAMIRALFFVQQAITSVKINNDQLGSEAFYALRMAEHELDGFFEKSAGDPAIPPSED